MSEDSRYARAGQISKRSAKVRAHPEKTGRNGVAATDILRMLSRALVQAVERRVMTNQRAGERAEHASDAHAAKRSAFCRPAKPRGRPCGRRS